MRVIDVHPEDLLDREASGVLSADQRVLLDAHLAHCESCRMERLMRADFAAESIRMNDADMQSFVLGALQRAASGETAVSSSLTSAPAAPPRARLTALLALAGVLLVAAGAAASRSEWVQHMYRVAFGEATLEQPQAALGTPAKRAEKNEAVGAQVAVGSVSLRSASVAAAAQAQASRRTERAAQAHDDERVPGPGLTPNEPRALQKPSRTGGALSERKLENTYRPAPRTARITNVKVAQQPLAALRAANQREQARAAAAPQPVVQPEPQVSAPPPPPDPARLAQQAAAAALFEQANRARRSGKIGDAAGLYGNLQREFAGSPEARLSYALNARMWLDAGDASAALSGFERYLASDERALREEAMTGRALALAKLGRNAAADQAFAELLKAYPYSSYAPLAKKRLGQD